MNDANKVQRVSSYLNSIWPSDTIGYELLSKKALHKFTHTKKHHKQSFYISVNYLSDHRLSVIVSDMDVRHVLDILMSNDTPKVFFLGYSSTGRVMFSVLDNEKSLGVGTT